MELPLVNEVYGVPNTEEKYVIKKIVLRDKYIVAKTASSWTDGDSEKLKIAPGLDVTFSFEGWKYFTETKGMVKVESSLT